MSLTTATWLSLSSHVVHIWSLVVLFLFGRWSCGLVVFNGRRQQYRGLPSLGSHRSLERLDLRRPLLIVLGQIRWLCSQISCNCLSSNLPRLPCSFEIAPSSPSAPTEMGCIYSFHLQPPNDSRPHCCPPRGTSVQSLSPPSTT